VVLAKGRPDIIRTGEDTISFEQEKQGTEFIPEIFHCIAPVI
jgi:hypothetical protein